jgi:hypothetical protein
MGGVFPRMWSSNLIMTKDVMKDITKDLESGSRNTRVQHSAIFRVFYVIACSSRTNFLLLLVPVGIPLYYIHVPPGVAFTINILAMIPLAGVSLPMLLTCSY